ncbi:MAG: hypothetical protein ABW321_29430 [Polyangiales bacterium]
MMKMKWPGIVSGVGSLLFGGLGCMAPPLSESECSVTEPAGCAAHAQVTAPSGRPAFCARDDAADEIRALFCADEPPTIGSLRDLQDQLGFEPERQGYRIGTGGLGLLDPDARASFVAASAHSTALGGHLVSAINPRVFMMTSSGVLAFTRGAQRVELVVRAADSGESHFYLLDFRQACNTRPEGCSPGDLYTPRIERDWTSVTIADDEMLKNSPLDCRQCHARGRDKPGLLMRELEQPWTHFFVPLEDNAKTLQDDLGASGRQLVMDYLAAKGDEPYANIPESGLRHTAAAILEGFSGRDQPLLFDSLTIERERRPDGPGSEPQPSATWERGYEAFRRGEQLALPYVDASAADPDKLARLTAAYRAYRAGEVGEDELPALDDIFPDDPQLRAQIGLQTEPDASPTDALIQACGSCHNYSLDQSLSRARFNIDLAALDDPAITRAIERIELPPSAAGAMPPPEARQLDRASRARLLAFLRQSRDERVLDPALQRAAELGMSTVTR